ncbi:MAG: hypothetical protein HRT57_12415 [Crocinitomicaceae bacterium]|nr:hypothetical protein [Crocinitomicaceae bacterium]
MKTNIVIGSMSLIGILCACSEQEFDKIGLVNPTVSELKLEVEPKEEQEILIEEPQVQHVAEIHVQPLPILPLPPGWGNLDNRPYDDGWISPPVIVPQLQFESVFESLKKPNQIVYFDNSRDTTLTFNQGTKITIKANSFQTESGRPLSNSKVKLSVAEYYGLGDLLAGNLNTQTKDGILETGGTVYIEANSGTQKCELKKGSTIQLEFPTEEKLEEMQVFEGEWVDNQIVWEAGTEVDEP